MSTPNRVSITISIVEVPAPCPHCGVLFVWEMELDVVTEIAWQAPHAPAFRFRCDACEGLLAVSFRWQLEAGAAPRQLRLVGGSEEPVGVPRILLIDTCPHGCELRLGLRLEPDDPWARSRIEPGEQRILGGYRCPRCDGEGRLRIEPVVESR